MGRLDNVDENYLWQRQSQQLSDRQRYLGDMTVSLGGHDRSRVEAGYTSEKSGFESKRVGVSTQLTQVGHSTVGVDFNLSSASNQTGANRLLAIKPSYRLALNPVVLRSKGTMTTVKIELAIVRQHTTANVKGKWEWTLPDFGDSAATGELAESLSRGNGLTTNRP